MKKAVGTILSGAGGSKYKAAEIITKILKHPKLAAAVEDTVDPAEREIRDTIITELLSSLKKLKFARGNSGKWHAYNYILHAIVPSECEHPDKFARYIGSSWKKVTSVMKNKSLIEEGGDWAIGHAVQTKKNAFAVQYREYLPGIEQWWTSAKAPTQASPCEVLERHQKGNHTIDKDAHARVCTEADLCYKHAAVYQMSDDKDCYEQFCKDEPNIGSVCKFQMFISLRPWWVTSPNSRTCQCVYHQNFDLIHDVYKAKVAEIHDKCECDCTFCEQGDGACSNHPCESKDSMSSKLFCEGGAYGFWCKCVKSACGLCGWKKTDMDVACIKSISKATAMKLWRSSSTGRRHTQKSTAKQIELQLMMPLMHMGKRRARPNTKSSR